MLALWTMSTLRVFFMLTCTETVHRCIMADLDLKLDGIANGLLVEQTDKKKPMRTRRKECMQAPLRILEARLE